MRPVMGARLAAMVWFNAGRQRARSGQVMGTKKPRKKSNRSMKKVGSKPMTQSRVLDDRMKIQDLRQSVLAQAHAEVWASREALTH